MNPTDPLADADPQFLAELEEFMTLPGLEGFQDMVNDDQITFFRRRLEILRRWPDEFLRVNCNYAGMLADVEHAVAHMTQLNADVEKATEAYLQAEADVADEEYRLFKKRKADVEKAYEENPFDPEVQRMKEELDELSKQFPKE